ncbi:unnamed protein product [Allacma fusca]|uniref:O-acyltransferase WSD1 C-terminal domain-containing protein n=1 Tax=Allacma fusca TaxID=39272 RepID=A0A8J2Q1F3_9HEXA|nr:unnamed protein product [Allacma fusca]
MGSTKQTGYTVSKLCYSAWFNLMILFAIVFTILALPPTLLVLSLVYLFRLFAFHTSHYFRPDLGKMLSTRSSIFGCDLIYQRPLCSLVGKHVYHGTFDLEHVRSMIDRNWVKARNLDGSLRNPELAQGVTSWLGFYFWKPDESFNLNHHVSVIKTEPDEMITDVKLNAIMSTMIAKPFERYRSPWEVFLVPNYVPDEPLPSKVDDDDDNNNNNNNNNNNCENPEPKFVILIHWNHSLMDGLSIAKLYLNFTNSSIQSFFPKPKRNSYESQCAKMLNKASFVVRAPYQSIRTPIESVDCNAWHLSEGELTKKMDMAFTPRIPTKLIQEIKDAHNVTFNSVVFTALTGAIRNFMIRSNRDKTLPDTITCGFPYPLPGHPEKLRNHMTFCTVKLPVGITNHSARLQMMDKYLKNLKRSTVPIMAFLLMPFVGALFSWMLRLLVKNRNTTVMFSNMPGPKYEVKDSMGYTLKDTMFSVGFGPGNLGIAFTGGSYNGGIRFCAELDLAFSTRKLSAKDLANAIVEEFNALKNCAEISV